MMPTEAEWRAKGEELFGPDMEKWRFVCPTCGNVMSVERARAEFAAPLKGTRYSVERECIGRYIDGAGCDWAAYGLFSGPVFVEREGGTRLPVFDFDGKPYTGGPDRRGVAVRAGERIPERGESR